MNVHKVLSLLIVLLITYPVFADSERAVIGAAAGAGAGLMLDRYGGVPKEIAVPVMTAVGAAIGHEYDRRIDPHDTVSGTPYRTLSGGALGAGLGLLLARNVDGLHEDLAAPLLAVAGALVGNRMDRRISGTSSESRTRDKAKQAAAQERLKEPDRHPGIAIVSVSLRQPNGMVMPVKLIRTGDKYIGPQGESYESLPDNAKLLERYAWPLPE